MWVWEKDNLLLKRTGKGLASSECIPAVGLEHDGGGGVLLTMEGRFQRGNRNGWYGESIEGI